MPTAVRAGTSVGVAPRRPSQPRSPRLPRAFCLPQAAAARSGPVTDLPATGSRWRVPLSLPSPLSGAGRGWRHGHDNCGVLRSRTLLCRALRTCLIEEERHVLKHVRDTLDMERAMNAEGWSLKLEGLQSEFSMIHTACRLEIF